MSSISNSFEETLLRLLIAQQCWTGTATSLPETLRHIKQTARYVHPTDVGKERAVEALVRSHQKSCHSLATIVVGRTA